MVITDMMIETDEKHFTDYLIFNFNLGHNYMITYKLKQYKNSNSSYNNFFYPRAVVTGEIDLNGIAEKVQQNSSLKKSDVLACLTELSEVMREALLDGKRVRINGLGIFKTSIQTKKMVEDIKDFNVSECIGGYKINFLPEYSLDANGRHQSKLISGVSAKAYGEYAEGVNDREGKKYNKIGLVTE